MGWGIVGSVLGSLGSSALSGYYASKAQREQIKWERERAQNAHQWEVEDLRNAGLNPVLSAGGSGAVTGGISAPMGHVSDLGQSFNSSRQTDINKKAVESQSELNSAIAGKEESQEELNRVNAYNNTRLTDAQIGLMKEQVSNFMANTALAKNTLKIQSNPVYQAGAAGQYSKGVGGVIGTLIGAMGKQQNNSSKSNFSSKQFEGNTD